MAVAAASHSSSSCWDHHSSTCVSSTITGRTTPRCGRSAQGAPSRPATCLLRMLPPPRRSLAGIWRSISSSPAIETIDPAGEPPRGVQERFRGARRSENGLRPGGDGREVEAGSPPSAAQYRGSCAPAREESRRGRLREVLPKLRVRGGCPSHRGRDGGSAHPGFRPLYQNMNRYMMAEQ